MEQDKKYRQFKTAFSEKLAKVYPQLGDNPDTVFEKIAALDPTATVKGEKHRYLYLEWICSRVLKSQPRQQDLYKIREDLELYGALVRLDKYRASRPGTILYNPYVSAQIGQYGSLEDLSRAVIPYLNLKDRKKSAEVQEAERKSADKNTLALYDGPEGRVVVPLTMEASQYWGKNTRWCISATKSDNLFDQYYRDGQHPVIMFLPKGTAEKFAFNEYDKASGRNVQDRAIYDPEDMAIKDENGVKTLTAFVTKVFYSPDFSWDAVRADKNLQRTVQRFLMLNPPIYAQLLAESVAADRPDMIDVPSVLSFAKIHSGADAIKTSDATNNEDDLREDKDERQTNVNSFALYFLQRKNGTNILTAEERGSLSALVSGNTLSTAAAENIMHSILSIPEPPLETAGDYLKDYLDKMAEVEGLKNGRAWQLDQSGDADAAEIIYLKSIPKEFWADEKLAFAVLDKSGMAVGLLIENVPEIFEHPKAWVETLDFIEIAPDSSVIEQAKNKRFAHIPLSQIDGVPFLKIVANLNHISDGKVICDLGSALTIYEAFGSGEGVDCSPIATRLAEIYPDGFDDPSDVQLASAHMPKCDLSALLEKTIARHPDFFEEVDPASQTVAMIETAIRHDPEALADVADRFFKMAKRPPALAVAFREMVALKSPYIAMVEQHFAPNGP